MLLKTSLVLSISRLLLLFLNAFIVHGLFYDDKTNHLAYAHFFGSVKQIGNYQIAKPKDVLAIRYLYHKLFYDILTYLFNGKATKK